MDTSAGGLITYSEDVEDFTTKESDQSKLKQVNARLLEFNRIFFGDQAKNFLSMLSNCENDEIFATN